MEYLCTGCGGGVSCIASGGFSLENSRPKNTRRGSGLLCLFALFAVVEGSEPTNPRSEKSPLFAFIGRRWYRYTFATYKAVYLPSN